MNSLGGLCVGNVCVGGTVVQQKDMGYDHFRVLGQENLYVLSRAMRAISLDRSLPGACDMVQIHADFTCEMDQIRKPAKGKRLRVIDQNCNRVTALLNKEHQKYLDNYVRYFTGWVEFLITVFKYNVLHSKTDTGSKDLKRTSVYLRLTRRGLGDHPPLPVVQQEYRLDDVDLRKDWPNPESGLEPMPDLTMWIRAGHGVYNEGTIAPAVRKWIDSYTKVYQWKAVRRYVRMRHVALFWWGLAMERHCALGGKGREVDKRSFDEMEGTSGAAIDLPPAVRRCV